MTWHFENLNNKDREASHQILLKGWSFSGSGLFRQHIQRSECKTVAECVQAVFSLTSMKFRVDVRSNASLEEKCFRHPPRGDREREREATWEMNIGTCILFVRCFNYPTDWLVKGTDTMCTAARECYMVNNLYTQISAYWY